MAHYCVDCQNDHTDCICHLKYQAKHKERNHSVLSSGSCDCGAVTIIPAPHSKDDGVRKPSHYQVFGGVESIEIIARSMTVSEFRGFCMGNVLKYRLRAGKKSELATMEKDLNKAAFYQELFDLHKGKCYAAE